LHAFVGMANHLHLLITPQAALPTKPSIGCGMARSSICWSRRRSTTGGRALQKNKPARGPAAVQGDRPTPQNAGTPAFGELLWYQISWAITVT
jgi:REP element-mobilizing transposase RayT